MCTPSTPKLTKTRSETYTFRKNGRTFLGLQQAENLTLDTESVTTTGKSRSVRFHENRKLRPVEGPLERMNGEVQAERKYLPVTDLTEQWHGRDTQDSLERGGRREEASSEGDAWRQLGRGPGSRRVGSADVQSFVPFGGLNVTKRMAYATNASLG